MSRFTLRRRPPALQWGALLSASLISVAAFELMRLPAALLLGAIAAGILLAWFEGRVKFPPGPLLWRRDLSAAWWREASLPTS